MKATMLCCVALCAPVVAAAGHCEPIAAEFRSTPNCINSCISGAVAMSTSSEIYVGASIEKNEDDCFVRFVYIEPVHPNEVSAGKSSTTEIKQKCEALMNAGLVTASSSGLVFTDEAKAMRVDEFAAAAVRSSERTSDLF
jgi:hypothetical protein